MLTAQLDWKSNLSNLRLTRYFRSNNVVICNLWPRSVIFQVLHFSPIVPSFSGPSNSAPLSRVIFSGSSVAHNVKWWQQHKVPCIGIRRPVWADGGSHIQFAFTSIISPNIFTKCNATHCKLAALSQNIRRDSRSLSLSRRKYRVMICRLNLSRPRPYNSSYSTTGWCSTSTRIRRTRSSHYYTLKYIAPRIHDSLFGCKLSWSKIRSTMSCGLTSAVLPTKTYTLKHTHKH